MIVCSRCKKIVGKAKLVIGCLYYCPECVYMDEIGEPNNKPKPRPERLQKETLFPVEEYTRREDR